MKKIKISNEIKALILSIMASLSVVVNSGIHEGKDLIKLLNQPTYTVLFFTIFMYIAFKNLIPKVNKENEKVTIILSIIASLIILLCESYSKVSSWNNVLGSKIAIISSLIKGIGIAIMCFFIFDLIFNSYIKSEEKKEKVPVRNIFKNTLIIFLCWIPYMIILAPGCMNADTRDQMAQVMNKENICWTSMVTVKEKGDILLNNHHPVFHTLLIGVFLKFGEFFCSYFLGLELYCILQSILFALTLAYLLYKLKKNGLPNKWSKICLVFFALFPLFPIYAMSIFKDTYFSIILIWFVIQLYELCNNPEKFTNKRFIIVFALSLLLMLMRNNGFYIILCLLPFTLIYFRKDKKMMIKILAVLLGAILMFKIVYTGVIFDTFGIRNGSKREMLSFPLQATARYVRYHKEEVTDEEKKVILKIFGSDENVTLDDVSKNYSPYYADNVKWMYNKYATDGDLKEYYKISINMFWKHPTIYVEAFLNQNFGWFWFENDKDNVYYNGITDKAIPTAFEGVQNIEKFSKVRDIMYRIVVRIFDSIPIVSCLFELCFYTWAYLVIVIVCIMRKKKAVLMSAIPIFANYLICFLGPVIYMRYALPMVICLPFILFLTFKREEMLEEEKNVKKASK